MTHEPVKAQVHDLPHLFQTIQQHTLSGRLTWTGDAEHMHVFFQHGTLVHAQVDPHGQISEDALDWLLTHHDGSLRWIPADDSFSPSPSITPEMALNFDRLLTIMVEGGLLNRPPHSDFDPAFFGLASAADEQPATESPAVSLEDVARTPLRLIFPPAEADAQLTAQLNQLDLAAQLALLGAVNFNGYVYYQPVSSTSRVTFGLIVCEAGAPTAVRLVDGARDKLLSGQTAYEYLAGNPHRPEVFRGAGRLLSAYRALLAPAPTTRFPATKLALQQAIAAFKQQGNTGAAMMSDGVDGPPLYLLFVQGLPICLVELEPATDRLKLVPQTRPLPLGQPTAYLSIWIAPAPDTLHHQRTASD